MKKKVLFIAISLAIIAAFYTYYQFNKPHRVVASAKPAASLNADQLFNQFEENEAEANLKYLGKIIEVSGNVYSIEKLAKGGFNLMLMNENDMFGIACSFDSDKLYASEILQGSRVIIKGECVGMLSDVVLIRCVIVKTE